MKKWIVCILMLAMLLSLTGCDSKDYKQANMFFDAGYYDKAMEMYTLLGNYKDSEEKLQQCQYQMALQLQDSGEYDRAAAIFQQIQDVADSAQRAKECNYQIAMDCFRSTDFEKAMELFMQLGDYKDSAQQLAACQSHLLESMLQGTWKDGSFEDSGIVSVFTFTDGKVYAESVMEGKTMLTNNGVYRIDTEASILYIDYPPTDKPAEFPYSFEGSKLVIQGVKLPLEKQ